MPRGAFAFFLGLLDMEEFGLAIGVGTIFRHPVFPTLSLHFVCLYLKQRKREPEGVHAWQIEGCNRNLRPKVAVAKKLLGNMMYNSFKVAASNLLLVAT